MWSYSKFFKGITRKLRARRRGLSGAMVETVPVNSIDEAMGLLYPRHATWGSDPSDWIFRGQGDAEWHLMPSAYRFDALLCDVSGEQMVEGPRSTVGDQITAEWRTLKLFLAQVDRAGLPFARPDDAMFNLGLYIDQDRSLESRIKDNTQEWPPRDLLQNLGLAQHYRLCTRLLDFTTKLDVAAYFAVAKAASLEMKLPRAKKVNLFTIWALRVSALSFLEHGVVEIVRVPRAHNPNLHAQSGLFVNYQPCGERDKFNDKFSPEPLDVVLDRAFQSAVERNADAAAAGPILKRLDIPAIWAPAMLRLLAEQGVSPAAYFPGYDGAAASVRERRFWRFHP
jgi:hypothetical protein